MSDFATTHLFVLFCSHSHRRRHRNELRAKIYALLRLPSHCRKRWRAVSPKCSYYRVTQQSSNLLLSKVFYKGNCASATLAEIIHIRSVFNSFILLGIQLSIHLCLSGFIPIQLLSFLNAKKTKNNNANFMMAMGDECKSLFSGKGEGRIRYE